MSNVLEDSLFVSQNKKYYITLTNVIAWATSPFLIFNLCVMLLRHPVYSAHI